MSILNAKAHHIGRQNSLARVKGIYINPSNQSEILNWDTDALLVQLTGLTVQDIIISSSDCAFILTSNQRLYYIPNASFESSWPGDSSYHNLSTFGTNFTSPNLQILIDDDGIERVIVFPGIETSTWNHFASVKADGTGSPVFHSVTTAELTQIHKDYGFDSNMFMLSSTGAQLWQSTNMDNWTSQTSPATRTISANSEQYSHEGFARTSSNKYVVGKDIINHWKIWSEPSSSNSATQASWTNFANLHADSIRTGTVYALADMNPYDPILACDGTSGSGWYLFSTGTGTLSAMSSFISCSTTDLSANFRKARYHVAAPCISIIDNSNNIFTGTAPNNLTDSGKNGTQFAATAAWTG